MAARQVDLDALIGDATPPARSRPRGSAAHRCERDDARQAAPRRPSLLARRRRRGARPELRRRRRRASTPASCTCARAARPRPRGVQAGGQGGPQEPLLPKGLGPRLRARSGECEGRDRRVPQGARAQPLLRRRAERPRHRAHPAPGEREEGKKEFLTAFNDPTNPTPEISARNLGQAYLEEKNYAEAVNWFRTSLEPEQGLRRGLPRPRRRAVGARAGSTRRSSSSRRASRRSPTDAELQLALGEAYFKAGRFSEARARLEEAARKDPAGPAGRARRRAAQGASRSRSAACPTGASSRQLARPRRRARAAALLLDAQGEVVVEAGDRRRAPSPDRRLPGHRAGMARAHRGPLRRRRRPLARAAATTAGTVILRPLKDGYYLVVALGPDGLAGRGAPPLARTPAEPPRRGALSVGLLDRLAAGSPARARSSTCPSRTSSAGRRPLDAADLDAFEEALLAADLGLPAVDEAMEVLRARSGEIAGGRRSTPCAQAARRGDPARARAAARRRALLGAALGRLRGRGERRRQDHDHRQAGRGPGRPRAARCSSCAADTFRAAAAEQLEVWAERTGAAFHRGAEGADPVGGADRRAARGPRPRPRRRARRHRGPAPHQGRT